MQATLSALSSVITAFLAFLLPLLFLPFLSDTFDGGKRGVFIIATLVCVILFALVSFWKRSLVIPRSGLTIGFGLLFISTLLTIMFSSPNKMAALTGMGMFYLCSALLFIVLTTLSSKRATVLTFFAVAGSGVLITILSALDRIGINLNALLGSTDARGIFPNGGPLLNSLFLFIALLMSVAFFFSSKKSVEKIAAAAISGVLALGLLLNASLLLPGSSQAPVLLSFKDSWSIALDVLKAPRTAILGVGTESYVDAFSILKPVALNRSPYWFVRFANARNLPLDIIVTHGILGLTALGLLALGILNLLRKTYKEELPLAVGVLACVLCFLFFPVNPMLFGFFTLLLIAWTSSVRSYRHEETRGEDEMVLVSSVSKSSRDERQVAMGVLGIACLVIILLAGSALYVNGRSLVAKATFSQALRAIRDNKAKEAYDLSRMAIQIAPYHEEFRRSFATTNLLIAQGLTQKENLSENDRKTALTLVQQSINEGKAAVALDPGNIANWQTLATVYESLIGAAKQADQWTIAAYAQAIGRAPADPKLRLDLAGVFRRGKNLEQAVRLLEQAVQLKPDYANAYFNLSDIAKELNKKDQQLVYLDRTLALIKDTDPQYERLKAEADALRKELGDKAKELQAEAKSATASATPRPTPTPAPVKQNLEASPSARPTVNTQGQDLGLGENEGIASPSAIPDVPQE